VGEAVRYVLIMCDDESVLTGPAELRDDPLHERWIADVTRRGVLVTGEQLRPVVDATTVRVRGGRTLVTDGPFAETKDVVGGFAVIECADLDEAIDVAAGHPYASRGCVEVRPVWQG
jgi:hypothetical protein